MLLNLASLKKKKKKKDKIYALRRKVLIIISHFKTGKTKFSEPSIYHWNIYWSAGKEPKLYKTQPLYLRHFSVNKEDKTEDKYNKKGGRQIKCASNGLAQNIMTFQDLL